MYNWYRHHAWGGMAMLSILLTVHALIGLPPWILFPGAALLLIYIIVSLVLTYRASPQLTRDSGEMKTPGRGETAADAKLAKVEAKVQKKSAKADAKRAKKGQESQ